MDCTSCGRANRTGARFCGGCGAALSPRCPACGSECEAGARFCDACGAPVTTGPGAPAEARKVVTIVFADLMGSTALHERVDPESASAFMERYYAAMRGAVEAERGQVTQLLGDGVKAVFGAPRVAEDDALRAVRAAVAMQRAFRALADAQRDAIGAIGLRVAVNTGEVVAQDEREIIGDPVNVAAHLQAQARDGDVLVGESTQRLVAQQVTLERVGTFTLKGRAEPVAAWRVTSLERPAGAPTSAFVGRDDELRRVLAVYEAAASERRARLAVVLGSPGLGKSRLLSELARRLGDAATLLSARCDATGGATFEPLAQALRAHLCGEAEVDREGVRAAIEAALPGDTAERPRIAAGVAALLAGSPASPEETFFVVRRLLAALASVRPVVLVIDDLHWAEPLLLDFVEHLVQWSGDVPLLVLAAARPELRDRRSSLAAQGGLVAEAVTLAGLDAGAATRLAANAIGADELPAAIAGRVLAASEGNPLFVGELARMLVQDGALVREGDRWITRASLADLEMPPTIQALLAARIERLHPEERAVLERAAVIGRHFSRAAVAELVPPELRRDLDARLEALRRSELIESDTGWLLGEPVLRFHHVLIRDAAYRRLLKNTRAELHTRFADWLASRVGDAPEHDEMLGWHLEQAHALLCELGPLDARGHALGERAAGHLAAAGRRALARDDLSLAAGLLGRALERLAADSPARAELALDWCETLLAAGDVGPAERALDELGRVAGDSGRLRAWHVCFSAHLAALTDPQALGDTADAVASAAQRLAAEGDAAGEAKAHSVHALVLSRLGRIGASEGALDLALAAARRGRDRRRSNAVLAGAPLAALWGPSPVTRASGRCLDVVRVLRITQGAPAVEAVALRCQGVLEALRGRADAARRMVASSRRLVEELGITQRLLEAELFAGRIELLEGDYTAAERCLRAAYEGLRAQGLDIDAAQAAALLGRALLAQGRADEALALSRESEQLAGDDRIAGIAWRCVRAEALARRGEHASAVEIASRAVELGAATDALLDHADARMALATALRAAGRAGEADVEEARAISLWEAKGATLLVERARRDARATPGAVRSPVAEAPSAPQRVVQLNAAIANAERLDALIAARDADALPTLLAADAQTVHHASGRTYDRDATLAAWTPLFAAEELNFQNEPLATLGESLALCRRRVSFRALARRDVDVGALELEEIALTEVDAQGLRRRAEFFSTDRLGDAVARLYARHAELLPAGPARERATTAAQSVALMIGAPGGFDAERAAGSFADDFESVDHRRAGFGSSRGAKAFLRALTSAFEVADDVAESCDDVLALQPDALLVRRTLSGRSRASGGDFETSSWSLLLLNAEGRIARGEFFGVEQGAAALARFEALTGGAAPVQKRRVRANAASHFAARLDAAVAAKDAGALRALFAEDMQVVHHPTDTRFGRDGAIQRFESLMRAEELHLYHEPVAVLGDSLVLCRAGTSVRALAEDDVAPAGAIQTETRVVIEVDAFGRECRVEIFAGDRLGDALACLYERYAEQLPEGRERERAATTARVVAALVAPPDLVRWAHVFDPAIDWVDHRTVGLEPLHGAEAVLRAIDALFQLLDVATTRVDDVLELRSDAIALRWTHFGIDVAGGGKVERSLCHLWWFGDDGRLMRWEQFEADRGADAFTRLDALSATRQSTLPRRVRANAATANAARMDAAVAARDLDAFFAELAETADAVSHSTGAIYLERDARRGYELMLASKNLRFGHEPLATLGDSLALCRTTLAIDAGALEEMPSGASDMGMLLLAEVDTSGLRRHTEFYVVDHLGDAIARLYARQAERLPEGPERERAAATARSVAVLLGSIEIESIRSILSAGVDFVDHRRLGFESARGVEAVLRGFHALFELSDALVVRVDDVLALCSDALLMRRTTSGIDRSGGGDFERASIQLVAFGADGLLAHDEFFDLDRVDEALARFDALTGASAEARFENAASRAFERSRDRWRARDWEGVRDAHAPTCTMEDRRSLVQLQLSSDEFFANQRMLFEVGSIEWSGELLATRGERLALLRVCFEGEALGSGQMAIDHLSLMEADEHGRCSALVLFDPAELEAAYAELDARFAAGEGAPCAELSQPAAAPSRFENAATRAQIAFECSWRENDWDRIVAAIAPGFRMDDRRALVGLSLSGEEFLVNLRLLFQSARRMQTELLASRGERLALFRSHLQGDVDGGLFEDWHLSLAELDDTGRRTSLVLFDPADVDAAYAELDARYAADAGPAYARLRDFRQATAARDWDAVRAQCTPDFVMHDHRAVGWEALHGGDAWVEMLRALVELAPDVRQRVDHFAISERASLMQMTWVGTREGGAFEDSKLIVSVWEPDGRFLRIDQYEVDQLPAARARYAELCAPRSAPRIENAATRAGDGLRDAVEALDFARASALLARDFRSIDRGRMARVEADRDTYVEVLQRMLGEFSSSHIELEHLATRGDRLSLDRLRWVGSGEDAGPSDLEWLNLIEVDDEQRMIRQVSFDPDDDDAAYAELDARYAAGQDDTGDRRTSLTRAFTEAFAARDWSALVALLAPDLVVHDHRRLGWETLRGPDAYVQALRSLVELAPDVSLRVDHATMTEPGYLYFTSWQGTREGGAFEEPSWIVCELDPAGRIRRFDQYDLEQQAEARARLAEIGGAEGAPDLLRIPPNAVSRVSDRFEACATAGDWDALKDLFSPTAVWEDRRPLFRIAGDREMAVRSARLIREVGARVQRDRLATSGDRLALDRIRFARDEGSGWEVEALQVIEVDAEGRIVATIFFDPDERRAAAHEMFERYARGEGARKLPRARIEAFRAQNAHDLTTLRALLPAEFIFHDHRRTGLGRLGPDDWLASLAQLFAQAPDLCFETLYIVASEAHGELTIGRMFGTQIGGGDFEGIHVRLSQFDGDRLASTEVFEPEQLDAARARFEALRPDPLRIPPNAASRVNERLHEAREALDWNTFGALCAQAFELDDRRRSVLTSGDREMFIVSNRWLAAQGTQGARTLLATAGDRLALERQHWWTGAVDAPESEAYVLSLAEVDAEGRAAAVIVFDPDDRRAAAEEMRERFFRGEGARLTPPGAIEHFRAWHDQDLARLRATLPDGFWFHDHRRTGAGRIDGADAYIRSVAALFEQVRDVNAVSLYHVALEAHGSLAIAHNFGTLVSGGAVESVFVRLSFYRDGEYAALELFELDDLERARARFEELRPAAPPPAPASPSAPPAPARVEPNAATRAMRRFEACVVARDWHALAELHAPDFVYEDRRPLMRDSGNREKLVASVRLSVGSGSQATQTVLATAGNRVSLSHLHFRVSRGSRLISEIEALQVVEVDAQERIVAAIAFDPADRAAADAELRARFEAQSAQSR